MSTIARPYILSIAGFDPSAGAGVLADIKTFEGLHLYGLGISTAITIQTDVQFFDCRWEELAVVQKQVEVLSARFSFHVVKIGIVPSLTYLNQLLDTIHQCIPQAKIVWDPVYASSTGFQFVEENWNENILQNVLRKISLLTPNSNEAITFGKEKDSINAAKKLSAFCAVLLKGGHSTDAQATDILFYNQQEFSFVQEMEICNKAAKRTRGYYEKARTLANIVDILRRLGEWKSTTAVPKPITRSFRNHRLRNKS